MVQTLSGNWWLWLVPLFIVSLLIMIPAALNELGIKMTQKQENTAPASEPAKVQPDSEEDDLLQAVLIAAAAYVQTENRHGGSKMRNLKITVNGKTYDVTVEEEGKSYEYAPRFSERKQAASSAAKPAAAAAPAVEKKVETPAPAAPAAEPVKPVAGDGVKLEAPMSGRVVEIIAPVGTSVKPGDAIVVMEAMKLQSEICAECAGVVKQIFVKEKQDIITGDAVALIG